MRLIKFLRRKQYMIVTMLIRLIATGFAGAITATLFVDAVYEQRGYFSIGGEWIVIIGLTFAIWKLTGYIAKFAWR